MYTTTTRAGLATFSALYITATGYDVSPSGSLYLYILNNIFANNPKILYFSN